MHCPSCSGPTRVIETRSADGGSATRRRRVCMRCEHRFTTFERREPDPLYVNKRSGERQRFDRTKLRAALLRAAHKRPVSAEEVERVVDGIESEAERSGGELEAERIVELCLEALRDLDPGAYLQFAGTVPAFIPEVAELGPGGSVRAAREHAELPPKTATRRDFNG